MARGMRGGTRGGIAGRWAEVPRKNKNKVPNRDPLRRRPRSSFTAPLSPLRGVYPRRCAHNQFTLETLTKTKFQVHVRTTSSLPANLPPRPPNRAVFRGLTCRRRNAKLGGKRCGKGLIFERKRKLSSVNTTHLTLCDCTVEKLTKSGF